MRRLGCALLFVLASACDGAGDDYMGEDIPTPCQTGCGASEGGSSTSGTGTAASETTGSIVDACRGSSECAATQVCAADFSDERTGFDCRESCIGLLDETAYCSDDSSCCQGRCNGRGYCVMEAP